MIVAYIKYTTFLAFSWTEPLTLYCSVLSLGIDVVIVDHAPFVVMVTVDDVVV